jgi:hypothetical protein
LLKLGGKWSERLSESVAYSSRLEAPLLQAADLLAYVVAQSVTKRRVRDGIAVYALEKLAYNREYIRAMDTAAIDLHLCKCPFRSTFWEGMTEPDFFEQLREQGVGVMACKGTDGVYRTHHLKRHKVRVIVEIDAQPLGGLNRTEARDDSTKKTRLSAANSTDDPQASQDNSNRQLGDSPKRI